MIERMDVVSRFFDGSEACLGVLDGVCLISPPCNDYRTIAVLIAHYRPFAITSFFGHSDLLCEWKEIVMNDLDELIEEVLDLSYEQKLILLTLLKSLGLSGVEQE